MALIYSTAIRRLTAIALAITVAASALVASLAADSAGAYIRHPKGCSNTSLPNKGSISASVHVKSKHPKVGNDPIKVTASYGGKPLEGGYVHYLFLWNNTVVSCQFVGPPAKPRFVHGVFRDVLQFPATAVLAQPAIVVRVVIEWRGMRKNADVAVSVHK